MLMHNRYNQQKPCSMMAQTADFMWSEQDSEMCRIGLFVMVVFM